MNAFRMAPSSAENANTLRELYRPATPKYELNKAPITKPIGTAADNQASFSDFKFQISINCGAITDALNHRLNANNSARPIQTNARHDLLFIMASLQYKEFLALDNFDINFIDFLHRSGCILVYSIQKAR